MPNASDPHEESQEGLSPKVGPTGKGHTDFFLGGSDEIMRAEFGAANWRLAKSSICFTIVASALVIIITIVYPLKMVYYSSVESTLAIALGAAVFWWFRELVSFVRVYRTLLSRKRQR